MLDAACVNDSKYILRHFICCVTRWFSRGVAFTMSTQIRNNDGEVVLKTFNIAPLMPHLATIPSTMQKYERWSRTTPLISNSCTIWGCCKQGVYGYLPIVE